MKYFFSGVMIGLLAAVWLPANGLGIIRDITFYNKDFLNAHPDIVIDKKSDSPDEDKSLADSKALIPVLKDFLTNILL